MGKLTLVHRRRLAICGGILAGIALGSGFDVLLAHIDGYLMQTISWSNPPGFPGLASFGIIVAGAFFGLGLGLLVAALIGEPSAHDVPTTSAVGVTQARPAADTEPGPAG
jgi:hypothetical protein